MMLCECDFRDGFCGLTMPVSVYDTLNTVRGDDEDRDLFIVHKDHAAGEQEIAREGEWLLVRADGETSSPSYTLAELEQLAKEWAIENEATTDARWIVSGLLAWLARKEREANGADIC